LINVENSLTFKENRTIEICCLCKSFFFSVGSAGNRMIFYFEFPALFSGFKLSKKFLSKLSKFPFLNCQNFLFQTVKNFLFKLSKYTFSNCQKFPFQTVKNFLSKLSKFPFPNCQNFLFQTVKISFSNCQNFLFQTVKISFSKLSKFPFQTVKISLSKLSKFYVNTDRNKTWIQDHQYSKSPHLPPFKKEWSNLGIV
jgi:hypothetical protein